MAGVYFEKILKNSKVSIWVRNIQLGLFGTFFALLTVYLSDYENVQTKGFFFGYTQLVWLNIIVQASGGLLVAVVIKYADNILKGFATSIAIIVSCLASAYLFDTIIDLVFTIGTFLVVLSVVLYSYTPSSYASASSNASGGSLLPTSAASSQLMSNASSLSSSPKSNLYFSEKSDSELIKYKLDSFVNSNTSGAKNSIIVEMNANSS